MTYAEEQKVVRGMDNTSPPDIEYNKHMTFARYLFEGKGAVEAYRLVFPDCPEQQVGQRAVRLAKKWWVRKQLNILKGEANSRAIITVTRRKEIISEYIELAAAALNPDTATPENVIKFIDLLNRMEQVYIDPRAASGTGNNTNINILVPSAEGKVMLQRVIEGERTDKELPSG